jgi:hypothetical protein
MKLAIGHHDDGLRSAIVRPRFDQVIEYWTLIGPATFALGAYLYCPHLLQPSKMKALKGFPNASSSSTLPATTTTCGVTAPMLIQSRTNGLIIRQVRRADAKKVANADHLHSQETDHDKIALC